MKVKVLIVPLLGLICLAIIIWLVFPAYSQVMIKRGALKDQNEKISDLHAKSQMVNALMDSLNSSADKQAIVMKFLPNGRNEEEIISNLNNIVSGEGASMSVLSVLEPKKETPGVEIPVGITSQSNGGTSTADTPQSLYNLVSFNVEMRVFGNYDKIKNITEKIYRLRRFNKMISLEIALAGSSSGEINPENLQADFVIGFNYLPSVDSIASVDNSIFSTGQFDMGVVDKINSLKSSEFSRVNLESTGKPNPFMP